MQRAVDIPPWGFLTKDVDDITSGHKQHHDASSEARGPSAGANRTLSVQSFARPTAGTWVMNPLVGGNQPSELNIGGLSSDRRWSLYARARDKKVSMSSTAQQNAPASPGPTAHTTAEALASASSFLASTNIWDWTDDVKVSISYEIPSTEEGGPNASVVTVNRSCLQSISADEQPLNTRVTLTMDRTPPVPRSTSSATTNVEVSMDQLWCRSASCTAVSSSPLPSFLRPFPSCEALLAGARLRRHSVEAHFLACCRYPPTEASMKPIANSQIPMLLARLVSSYTYDRKSGCFGNFVGGLQLISPRYFKASVVLHASSLYGGSSMNEQENSTPTGSNPSHTPWWRMHRSPSASSHSRFESIDQVSVHLLTNRLPLLPRSFIPQLAIEANYTPRNHTQAASQRPPGSALLPPPLHSRNPPAPPTADQRPRPRVFTEHMLSLASSTTWRGGDGPESVLSAIREWRQQYRHTLRSMGWSGVCAFQCTNPTIPGSYARACIDEELRFSASYVMTQLPGRWQATISVDEDLKLGVVLTSK